jgi:DNA-binding NtrC family response regulator
MLSGFAWPGNVRQLENAIYRAVVLAEGDEIGVNEFPQVAALSAGAGETPLVPLQESDGRGTPAAAPLQPLVIDPTGAGSHTSIPAGATLPLLDSSGDVLPLEAVEAAAIRFAIAHYRGQMSEVARKLRIGRSTLYRKLDALGLTAGPGKADVADG